MEIRIAVSNLYVDPERVIVNDVEYVPEYKLGEDVTKQARPLQVGDFVRVTGDQETFSLVTLQGNVGKVVHMPDPQCIGVEFPKDVGGHDCNGNTGDRHGWYLPPSALERIE